MAQLTDLLERQAKDRADAAAISGPDGILTFDALDDRVRRLAAALHAAGIGPGDVVAVAPPNGVDVAVGVLASHRVGAVAALLPAGTGASDWRAIRGAVPLAACLASEAAATSARGDEASGGSIGSAGLSTGTVATRLRAARGIPWAPPPGTALLKFTSGSTGVPKGIALTEENLMAEASNIREGLGLRAGERILAPVPLTHSYGFDLGILPLLAAGTLLEIPGAFVPRRFLGALAGETRALFLGVPSMYRTLLDVAGERPAPLGATRWLLSCTAPLDAPLLEEFAAKFGAPICQHYGSSETGAVANHDPREALRRPLAVGRALPGVIVEIVDEEGAALPPGREGEVAVRGTAVSPGYALAGEEERSRLRGGTFRTRDQGRLDEEGYLTILGRLDDVINVGGFKVFPSEVERALLEHPSVREAAAVGVRDAHGESFVAAAVTLRAPATEEDLIAACHQRLADYKVPRRIDVRRELPTTPAGKVRLRAEDFAT